MFTCMNTARLGTALQGLAHAEVGFQGGIQYARDRLQMRSLTGPKAPEKAADPIIVHPDVRRMLLTMKSFAEGCRAMVYFTAKQVDIVKNSTDPEQQKQADALLALLTLALLRPRCPTPSCCLALPLLLLLVLLCP